MSEKFNLKWNDFQANVSRTFGLIRKEKKFFDVTLVSADQVQVPAHRVVLSACSSYFKNILTEVSHPHPVLCLDGIQSQELHTVLDYIYQGEVQIFQENLEKFLAVAEKLHLEGLISSGEEKVNEEERLEIPTVETARLSNQGGKQKILEDVPERNEVTTVIKAEHPSDLGEVSEQINQNLIENQDGSYSCGICGKTGNTEGRTRKFIMQRHLETHIEGLSYPCLICGKSFRSKNSLNSHTSLYHRH